MRRLLLRLSCLWSTKATITFTLQPNNIQNKKTYLGLITITHRIFSNCYLFPFYWYANTSNAALSKRFIGSYELSELQEIALEEGIKMSLIGKLYARTGKPSPSNVTSLMFMEQ